MQASDSKRGWLMLPIETKVRELHGKCLLAVIVAEAGMPVILGDMRVLALATHRLPPGVFLDKSASRTKIRHYAQLKRLGFAVAAWCEEGLVYRDKRAYQVERISPVSLSLLDAFFAWGHVHQRDVTEVAREAAHKIRATGNPRFDVLRPEYQVLFKAEAKALVSRYGPYILVNTNFSRFNHFRGANNFINVLRKRGVVRSDQDEAFYRRMGSHFGALFEAFCELVPVIAKEFPHTTIVVRPHPSEDHQQYRATFKPLSNVVVLHEGSVIPWIMGATAIVHNSCTTGVEAFLLNRRTIAYMPVSDEVFDSRLPNGLSEIARSAEEVLQPMREAIEQGRCERQDSAERQALLARYLGNGERTLACDEILPTLLALGARAEARTSKRYLSRALAAGHAAARRAARRLRGDRKMAAYADQKFPGISESEVKGIVEAIAEARGNRAPRVRAHPDLANCFVIELEPQCALQGTVIEERAYLENADLPAA